MRQFRDRILRLAWKAGVLALCGPPALLQAQSSDCSPGWLPTFGSGPGVTSHNPQFNPYVSALSVISDSAGSALYVGGDFSIAGSSFPSWNIAKWDGQGWSAVGPGFNGPVLAFAVYDDGRGQGPALYAAGQFQATFGGGTHLDYIAKWSGTAWEPLGGGLGGQVLALQVFDDGSGPKLYAGGDFSNHVARWDGSSWSSVGAGFNNPVDAFAVFDDGRAGPRLYAGGHFLFSGAKQVRRIAVWDGTGWSAVGAGLGGGNPQTASVRTFAIHDDGSGRGPALYAGGEFVAAGGAMVSRVARWDGTIWSELGSGANGVVKDLAVFDDGTGDGPRLYAFGDFTLAGGSPAESAAVWDGSDWSSLAEGVDFGPRVAEVFDSGDGRGAGLIVGGHFDKAGGLSVGHIARWDASGWSPLSKGLDGAALAFTEFDDGNGAGPGLYVGGQFTGVDGVVANGIARWDGSQWSPLAGGMSAPAFSGFFPFVRALAVFDDGRGPALYAGGEFKEAGGLLVNRIARWDGATWSALGTGMNDEVTVLVAADSNVQGGAALYAAGTFTTAGGVSAFSLARWDGQSWSSIGDANDLILALAIHDDGGGGGPALYAGGQFAFLGVPAKGIAKWNGSSWTEVGGGLSEPAAVRTLVSYDDGSGGGPALFAGGDFTIAGGGLANRVAKWTGSTWIPLGSGPDDEVNLLAGFDDGTGPALYSAGSFESATGGSASRVSKWNGTDWLPLERTLGGWARAMGVVDHWPGSGGPRLLVGGSYLLQPETGDGFLASWGECASSSSPWTDLGFALPGVDGPPLLAGTGELVPGTPGSLALTHAAPSAFAPLLLSLVSNPTPFKGGVLVPLPALLTLPLATSSAGALTLAWPSWPGGLAGLSLYFQHAIVDAAAVYGLALSNALRAEVP